MSGAAPRDRLADHARALAALEAFLARRRAGRAESEAELLDAHEELRDVLAAMLAGAQSATMTLVGGADVGAIRWRGLPDEQQEFGPYRIVRLLGQGGMGTVFLAEHRELGRVVALKLIRPERLFATRAKERFWREAKAIARLDHPGLCPVWEVGEAEGVPFMAMRFVEGRTLAALIAEARARGSAALTVDASSSGGASAAARKPAHAVARLIEDVARALHHAHERGVIHRDVKPGNVIVDPQGRPVVLDFGVARDEGGDASALTMTGDLPGTPLYMSPEQVAPRGRQLDRTTDVWSLGATLYECLTLRPMFEAPSTQEVFAAILQRDPVRPSRLNPAVPRDLEVVLQKATEKERHRRYRTAEELAEDLRRVCAFEPIRARPAGPVLRARRWIRRHPAVVGVIAVLLAALGAVSLALADARRARADFRLVGGVTRLRDAIAAEPALYPATPQNAPRMRLWLEQHATPLALLRTNLDEILPRLRARALPAAAGEAAQAPRFADAPEQFLHDTAAQLTADLDAFAATADRVRRLLAHAETVEAETAGAHAAEWERAIAAIAAHPKYGELQLRPQIGLVPLGESRQSGLWEFVHVGSGTLPAVDPGTGALVLTADTGIVLVLLPGGRFAMGAQAADEHGLNHDPDARKEEGPVHDVALAAFFMAKYELTQAQWKRLTAGEEPSALPAGRKIKGGATITAVHPVEQVDHGRCQQVLGWFGLELPTEAQWEYAARGGQDTPWWTGEERESLRDRVNLADQAAKRAGFQWSEIEMWPELDDGFVAHAPVDAFGPNPFGLYQVHGNVWEWCRDWYDAYEKPCAQGDGERVTQEHGHRVSRGGAFTQAALHARAAYRGKGVMDLSQGLRPARRIDG